MRTARAILLCAVALAVGALLVSGGDDSGPRTPPALPGLPPPFLGTAVSGDGGLTAAVDAYGDVVDLRPGPAGAALIANPSDRQAAGTVPEDTGIVPRVDGMAMWDADEVTQRYLPGTNVVRTVARFGGARVVMTVAAVGDALAVTIRTRGGDADHEATPSLGVNIAGEVRCARESRAAQLDLVCGPGRVVPPVPAAAAEDGGGSRSRHQARVARQAQAAPGAPTVSQASARLIAGAREDARRWVGRSHPLGADAPAWARAMYERSLLTVHALTSRATGAVAAGARDGWAYVWPRDAATAALALEASGHRAEARHVARFLTGLDLAAAARFTETGAPVPGRAAQGDALGWVTVAADATDIPAPPGPFPWRDRADYQESTPGTYLANALAAAGSDADGPTTGHIDQFSAHRRRAAAESRRIAHEFGTPAGLVRRAGSPDSGVDSAAGWAVRPFRLKPLYPAAQRTLLQFVRDRTPYGITPGEGWTGGPDPWTAPTAWSAWALAGLSRTDGRGPRTNLPAVRERGVPSRRSPSSQSVPRRSPSSQTDSSRLPSSQSVRQAALALLADLRRAATPAGDLPERVGVQSGIPTSTTPLLWSSAFAVLALRELWP